MVDANAIATLITEELSKLKREAHWGELMLRITLKNGDVQQIAIVNERTFRDLPPPPPARP
jgi:hypothetical protein